MPAIAAVAIPAAAAVVGGIIQSHAAGNAAKREQQTADKALAYQQQRQGVDDKRYDAAWQDYLTRHAAWEKRNFGGGTPAGGGGGNAGFMPGPTPSLANLLMPAQTPVQPQLSAGQPQDVQKTTGWNDWGRYGAGGL